MIPEIRTAGPSDADQVARIYVESWNQGFGALMPAIVLDDARVERWRTDLGDGPRMWWIARRQGLAVGFVGIGPSRDPVTPGLGELDTIAVDPPCWRAGVGTALMRVALDGLISSGFDEAVLWTLAAYPRGQRFYESTGWRPDGGTRDGGHQVSFRHDLRLGADRSGR